MPEPSPTSVGIDSEVIQFDIDGYRPGGSQRTGLRLRPSSGRSASEAGLGVPWAGLGVLTLGGTGGLASLRRGLLCGATWGVFAGHASRKQPSSLIALVATDPTT